ncbi:hypothetical protein MCAP1_002006 [Malassezia caprae]|uniref:SUN domain-containing protein n=1 Tax=Malassezia caprae TaxID=1381934 RepID=A0AAF0E6N1_9BASI|nr:hypothetical protein MCAP1_002006 [Malassezia caprae]
MMQSGVGPDLSEDAGRNVASPLRRSARLSGALYQRNGTPSQTSAPGGSTNHSARRRTRGAKSDVMDASTWSSSLYTARDPSQVSSYYLRPQEEDGKDGANESVSVGEFPGLGSLLRGSQRPPETPKSSVYKKSSRSTGRHTHDYSEEDRFMAQVESDWRQQADAGTSARDAPAETSLADADDSVFVPQQTPSVPGLFRSVLRPSTGVPPEGGSPTDEASRRARFFASPESSEPLPRRSGSVRALLMLVLLGVALSMLALRRGHLFRTAPAPLVASEPWAPSATQTDVHQRISALEKALNKVWQTLGDTTTETRRVQETFSERLSSLERRSVFKQTLQALEDDVQVLRKAHEDRVVVWQSEKQRLDDMHRRLTALERMKGDRAGGSSSVHALQEQMSEVVHKLQQVERQAREAEMAASEVKRTLAPLKQILPERLPVRYDTHTKKLLIDPAFWQELKKRLPKGAHAQEPMPWADFVNEHRADLDAALEDMVRRQVDSGVLLDRASFMQLMEAELARAKVDLSARFNEHAQDLQNDVLAKVRQQQAMYERSGSWERPAAQDDTNVGHVRRLIDAALAQFAADHIARADFAQYSSGGRVIPSLTSPTHELQLPGRRVDGLSSMLSYLLPLPMRSGVQDTHTLRGRMPVVALHHDTSPGMCWPFSGTHGQLGIQLVRRIRPTAVTIDHVPASLALDGQASAPRDMEVWGVADSPAEQEALARWRLTPAARAWSEEPSPVPPSSAHVFLGSFVYDAAGPPIQTFPLSHAASAALPMGFRVVQVNVLSNYGMRDYTCLYRVRVHGEPVA